MSAKVAATLDLSQPGERAAHDTILWATTGRWPLWRLLGVRRHVGSLAVAVKWKPKQPSSPRDFSLIVIDLRDRTMRWLDFSTSAAALDALRAFGRAPDPAGPVAPAAAMAAT
jgi:hypothetical protein